MMRMGKANFFGSTNLRLAKGDRSLSHFSIMMMTNESGDVLMQLAEALLPGLDVGIGIYLGGPELIITDPRCHIITQHPMNEPGARIAYIRLDQWDRESRIVLIDTVNPLQIKLEGEIDTPERRAALEALGFSELPGASV